MIIKQNQTIEHNRTVYRNQQVNYNDTGKRENAKWNYQGTYLPVYHLAQDNWTTSKELEGIQRTAEQIAHLQGTRV
jgi:hypothetical protein